MLLDGGGIIIKLRKKAEGDASLLIDRPRAFPQETDHIMGESTVEEGLEELKDKLKRGSLKGQKEALLL